MAEIDSTSSLLGTEETIIERPGTFHYLFSNDLNISIGDFVIINLNNRIYFGQVGSASLNFVKGDSPKNKFSIFNLSYEQGTINHSGFYAGEGKILAEFIKDIIDLEFNKYRCSGKGVIRKATNDEIENYFNSCYEEINPLLPIGSLLNEGTPIRINLIPKGLNRNTGIFGQSGSGKSFGLSIVVEELHFRTSTDIVVLDPNGDFLNIKEELNTLKIINNKRNSIKLNKEDIKYYQSKLKEKDHFTKVLSLEKPDADDSIFIRLSDLETKHQAYLFGLDPIENKDEFHNFIYLIKELKLSNPNYTIKELVLYLRSRPNSINTNLYIAIENLGLENLSIWEKKTADTKPLVDLLNSNVPQTVVVDLSNISYLEKNIISTVVLATLWEKQFNRKKNKVQKPTFLVIDEAHNLFPRNPGSKEDDITLELGSKIAGEGRKFGLYFLIASQLPSKIHDHILTQCGNLILMKMLSQSDLATLCSSFSFVSEKLLNLSRSFSIGQALLIGSFVPAPCLIHFESKKTKEGGRDLDIKWD